MFIRKRTLNDLIGRIYTLERYAKNDYEKLGKDYERLVKLDKAVFPPEGYEGMYSLLNDHMNAFYFGEEPKKKKPTYISILEEKFDAAMNTLGIKVAKQSATNEKFVAKKVTQPKKGKK